MNKQPFIKFLLVLLRFTKRDLANRAGQKSATCGESQNVPNNLVDAVWCYEI
jgi:hypothetical protein